MLGPADVADDVLAAMVADLLGHDSVDLLEVAVDHVPYDVPSLTTVGRYWVTGRAATPTGRRPFRLFVKHVQAWHHSRFFADVPAEIHEMAKASYPWRTEPLAYASDLGDRLPEGLSMPRAVGVVEFEPDSAAIWMEPVDHPPVAWDAARYRRAAYLLGRLAASPEVADLGNVGRFEWSVMQYVHGRLVYQVVPMLRADDLWRHPVLAAGFGTALRDRLLEAADRVEEYGEELARAEEVRAHGDASPGNLMPGPDPDSFVLIDFGFWRPQPVGFDLGQLVAGDVQLGKSPASGPCRHRRGVRRRLRRGSGGRGARDRRRRRPPRPRPPVAAVRGALVAAVRDARGAAVSRAGSAGRRAGRARRPSAWTWSRRRPERVVSRLGAGAPHASTTVTRVGVVRSARGPGRGGACRASRRRRS